MHNPISPSAMRRLRRHSAAAAALGGTLLVAALVPARAEPRPHALRPALVRRAAPTPVRTPPTREDTARALHLLNRATFGARPADVAEVLRSGREAWLDRQLHPERIPDSAAEARLAAFPA